MQIIRHGDSNQKKISLTFDDGPSEETLPVLEILKKHNIKATFFVVGTMIAKREYIIKQAKDDGHAFGNHTFTHARLWFKSKRFIENEIIRCDQELARLGITTNLFRFPGFRWGFNGFSVCRKLRKKVIFGTLFYDWVSRDWLNPWLMRRKDIHGSLRIKGVVRRIMSKTRNGSVLVLHDYLQGIGPHKEIGEILDQALPELKKRYTIVPLEEMI